ncbi:hypothetical protein [Thermogymnomonas acidicola]|uniref:hypothetical protein n=1 Tax=Thermogymnomonas acidicola TaxID=399579 RepID=UPI00094666F0|nr:hypothetical protein [Thermogymnomonas acidicola]
MPWPTLILVLVTVSVMSFIIMYALLGHSGPPECLQRPRDVSIPESELSELASWVRANASRVTVDTYELYEARAGRYRATLYIDWEDFNSGPEFQDIPVLCSCEVYVYRGGMRLVYSAYLTGPSGSRTSTCPPTSPCTARCPPGCLSARS